MLFATPIDHEKSIITSCCSKQVCKGCSYANRIHRAAESIDLTCVFCRHPVPTTQAEADLNRMKRFKANDPVAILEIGIKRYLRYDGGGCLIEYLKRAAELRDIDGDIDAQYHLSVLYRTGELVEKDEEKVKYHLEEAAIGGARYDLAFYEGKNNRIDRAVKYLIIAANLGHDGLVQKLKEAYLEGDISKEDFAAALRATRLP